MFRMSHVLLTLVVPVPLLGADAVSLQYRPVANQSIILKSTRELRDTIRQGGVEKSMEVTIVEVSQWTPTAVEKVEGESLQRWLIEVKRLRIEVDGIAGKAVFDSKSTDRDRGSAVGNSITQIGEAMTGAYIDVWTTPRGEIRRVDQVEQLIGKLTKQTIPQIASAFGGGSNAGAAYHLQDALPVLPGNAVKKDAEWSLERMTKVPNMGTMKLTKGQRLIRVEEADKKVLAHVSGKIEGTFKLDARLVIGRVTGTYRVQQGKESYVFDTSTGALVKSMIEVSMRGAASIELGGQIKTLDSHAVTSSTSVERLDSIPE